MHSQTVREGQPLKGETQFCATSLESLLDFVSDIFGQDSRFHVLTTRHLTAGSSSKSDFVQNYTIIEAPEEMSPSKMVGCHTMSYPYTIFFCHSQTGNKVFKVLLCGENGDKIEAISVCHMDTSNWNRDHVAFKILATHPGSSEVCHFFPEEHLVWLPAESYSQFFYCVLIPDHHKKSAICFYRVCFLFHKIQFMSPV
ncbi:hypothetical protein Tsubulata_038641 [Turnera subulata]|uniref:BURP domain-containing protein n=1 Tax=Turnera subulata TaxID=218843 RepID=A0A9Q0F9W6_9ROSI|nr:hypothetical protein Tsubulata_038641 [Turnera subulata]